MSLKQLLVKNAPRDRSGSLASDRFEYQRNWAFCELLKLHLSGADYVITFDHHEDVSVLNSEVEPSEVRAYQIKTKGNGNWTDKALLKRNDGENGPLPSMMGKLCSTIKKFSNTVKALEFVSNAPYRIVLAKDNKCDLTAPLITFDEIAQDKQENILQAMKEELDLDFSQLLSGVLALRVSSLSLEDHATHTRGKLVDALNELFPNRAFPIPVVYRSILGEITARNNNYENIGSYEDLLRKKSLSRSRFIEILEECGVKQHVADWNSIETRLNSEGVALALLLTFRKHWQLVMLERVERRGDLIHVAMLKAVRDATKAAGTKQTLIETLDATMALLRRRPEWDYSEEYLHTCALVQIYES